MNFLLEIGTEEIPHWMIPGAIAQLEKLELFGATPKVDATPRRLVVRADGLPERTPDQEQLVKGPPISAGEKAALGFAKKQGVDLSAMQRVGEYYELRKQIPGRATCDLLAESLPASILGIQWPKTMYWGVKGGPRFIRPIRWIVALLDDQIIPFEIAGVAAGNVTNGHRMFRGAHPVYTYASVENVLKTHGVILSASDRRLKIEEEARKLGATIDPELLETLTYITEFPAAIKGDFDPAYLELPAEVLTMVMRHHQKYFAVETSPGVLAPHFVAVMNIPGDPDGLVKRGNERVLKARFNDARFFWEVDQKKKLEDRVEDLSHVTFQAKLGSYLEKTHRVVALVKELGGDEHAQRAAWLAKADLTTEMVKEFTDLQGIVGGLYAKAQNEPKAVSDAIYEHYKPLSMEDSIPSTKAGQFLALADKLDNLREFFRIDMVPTGSKDPFALRRAAQGVFRIVESGLLNDAKVMETLANGDEKLLEFLNDRYRHYYAESYGYDVLEAVLSATPAEVPINHADFRLRLALVSELKGSADFLAIARAVKRIRKIREQALRYYEPTTIIAADFEEGPERNLYLAYQGVVAAAREHFPNGDYRPFLYAVVGSRPAVDEFFESVMVMDPDPARRKRRLELLYRVDMQFNAIADFSEIVTSGDQK